MKKDAKIVITTFMQEHFGEWVGKELLAMKIIEYQHLDWDNYKDYELKAFLNLLFETTFSKFMTKDEVKMNKLIMMTKIFGKEEAIESMSTNISSKTTQPLNFMRVLFGNVVGDAMIDVAGKVLGKNDIRKSNELDQVLFMKEIIGRIFRSNKNIQNNVNLDMLRFMKSGSHKKNIIEAALDGIKTPENFDEAKKAYKEIVDFMKDSDPGKLDKIIDELIKQISESNSLDEEQILALSEFVRKYACGISEKIKIKQKHHKKKKSEDKSLTLELTYVLEPFLGLKEAKRVIGTIQKNYALDDIRKGTKKEKSGFIKDLMQSNLLKDFSMQRERLVKIELARILKI